MIFAFAWLLESGSAAGLSASPPQGGALYNSLKGSVQKYADDLDEDEVEEETKNAIATLRAADPPPGLAISYLGVLDLMVLATIFFMGAGMLFRFRSWGRVQALASLILGVLVLLAGIALLFKAIGLLFLMVGLFLATPFGTIAYIATYGFFPTGTAKAILGSALFLKVIAGVCLVLAQQRMLKAKALVAIILSSLLGSVIISFLHGIVPGFLVSITDAIAAIVVIIIALIWAVLLIVFAIIGLVKGLSRD